MTDKATPQPERHGEQEAERRFQDTLKRLVNTPHKKHEPIGAKPGKAKPKT